MSSNSGNNGGGRGENSSRRGNNYGGNSSGRGNGNNNGWNSSGRGNDNNNGENSSGQGNGNHNYSNRGGSGGTGVDPGRRNGGNTNLSGAAGNGYGPGRPYSAPTFPNSGTAANRNNDGGVGGSARQAPNNGGNGNSGHGGGSSGGNGNARGGSNGGNYGNRPILRTVNQQLPYKVNENTLIDNPAGWLDATNLVPPAGKEPGTTCGRQIPITVNSIEVETELGDLYFQYDVAIDLSMDCKKAKKARLQKKKALEKEKSKNGEGGEQKKGQDSVDEEKVPDDTPKQKLWQKIMKASQQRIESTHESISKRSIKIATDFSKAIYSTEPLAMIGRDNPEYTFQVALSEIPNNDGNTEIYDVTIKQSALIDTTQARTCFVNLKEFLDKDGVVPGNMADIERVINVAIKTMPTHRDIPVGRASFYPEPVQDGFSLGGGVVNWTGYSIIFSLGWRPFINIDVANSAFILGRDVFSVLQQVCSRRDPRDLRNWDAEDFKKANAFLVGCSIFYFNGVQRVQRKVKEVLRLPARRCEFEVIEENGRKYTTNVEEYFLNAHNKKFRNPNGLCLKVGETAIIPAEICTIAKGQPFTKKLTDDQTSRMIKDTAKPPAQRLDAINRSLRQCNFQNDPVLRQFNITVPNPKLHEMTVRVQNPPELIYRDRLNPNVLKAQTPGKDGTWNMSPETIFFKTANSGKKVPWTVLVARDGDGLPPVSENSVRAFVNMFIVEAQRGGVNLGTVEEVLIGRREYDVNTPVGLQEVLKQLQEVGYMFVLCVLLNGDSKNYNALKSRAETSSFMKNGLLTQCVQAENLKSLRKPVVENLMKKLNVKLGGINHLVSFPDAFKNLDILRCPTMIFGADVTHPQQGSMFPSLAAVTGTLDLTGMTFGMISHAQTRAERGAAEVIEGLEDIVVKYIKAFVKGTGYKPRRLFFFRDGVGDGQFNEVLKTEMMAIRSACKRISSQVFIHSHKDRALGETEGVYEPKITFIAVQKRHKTRFFPKNSADGVGKPLNCPPGTIVDTDIVNARTIDYYVLSHTGIQGTSKPSRYQVLWDDSEFSVDELQVLSNYLCFGYARCNRSVSYPCPTYYAHLACTRAKVYASHLPEGDLTNLERVNAGLERCENIVRTAPMHYI